MSDKHPRPWRLDAAGDIEDSVGDQVAFIEQGLMMFPTPAIRDLIVAAVNAHSPWISVEDRLPDKDGPVFGFRGGRVQIVSYSSWDPDCLWCELSGITDIKVDDVTHWMPLPAR